MYIVVTQEQKNSTTNKPWLKIYSSWIATAALPIQSGCGLCLAAMLCFCWALSFPWGRHQRPPLWGRHQRPPLSRKTWTPLRLALGREIPLMWVNNAKWKWFGWKKISESRELYWVKQIQWWYRQTRNSSVAMFFAVLHYK